MAAFPSEPLLLIEGLAPGREPGVLRTPTESGLVKQRKHPSRIMRRWSVRYLCRTKAHYTALEDWFEDTVHRTDWFDWTDPLTGGTREVRIMAGTWDAKPTRKNLERWVVSFTVEYWE